MSPRFVIPTFNNLLHAYLFNTPVALRASGFASENESTIMKAGGKRSVNSKKLATYKKQLRGQLEELMGKSEETINGMETQRSTFPDPADRATLESNRNRDLRIRERELNLMSKIRAALERIDSGTFGICDMCGKPIDQKRLRARPVTTLCIECKTEQEEMERRNRK